MSKASHTKITVPVGKGAIGWRVPLKLEEVRDIFAAAGKNNGLAIFPIVRPDGNAGDHEHVQVVNTKSFPIFELEEIYIHEEFDGSVPIIHGTGQEQPS